MSRLFYFLLGFFFCVCSDAGTGSDAYAKNESKAASLPIVQDFVRQDGTKAASMSPNGEDIALISRRNDVNKVFVAAIDAVSRWDGFAKSSPFAQVDLGGADPIGVVWVSNETLLITMQFIIYTSDRRGRWTLLPVIQSFLVPAHGGGDMVPVAHDDEDDTRLYQTSLVHFLPAEPDAVLLSYFEDGLGLARLDIKTGKAQVLEVPDAGVVGWVFDKTGQPVFRKRYDEEGSKLILETRYEDGARTAAWQAMGADAFQREDAGPSDAILEPFFPLEDNETWYAFSRTPEDDRVSIAMFDPRNGAISSPVFAHPKFDIEIAISDARSGSFFGFGYIADQFEIEAMSDVDQRHLDGLRSFFSIQQGSLSIMEFSSGRQRWLLFVQGPKNPGTFYVYDLSDQHVTALGPLQSSLQGKPFGTLNAISFTTRDGIELTGYLSRPRFIEDDYTHPLIVMPHGGPAARDAILFNPLAQLLTLKGYQVFQPNFRGSTGYGVTFTQQSYGQWGRAVQNDIVDASQALFDRGLAQKEKACVMGASFGGYLALATATFSPDVFQCAIGLSGVYDLRAALKAERRRYGAQSAAFRYWQRQIGDYEDKAAIKAMSPAQHPKSVEVPVLLMHGVHDDVLDEKQSKKYAKKLKRAGVDVRYVPLENSTHSFRSPVDQALEYGAILDFLAQHMPTPKNNVERNTKAYESLN